ncbi:ATPase [Halobacteriales archaeon QS_1_67_19]|nr:MAG: ATPase [Halobacteriales archaeon QS_1_67_19]
MRLLVAGGHRVDAGETTFTTGLLERLEAVGFKPRAGNDYWFDHDDYRSVIADGRLYGKDAARLAEASASTVSPEDLNPVHRLWRPSPGPDTGLVGRADRQFVLDRVGSPYAVNAGANVPESAARNLPLADAPEIGSVERLDEVTQRLHVPALRAFADRIRDAEPAVVESYGDVAVPIRSLSFDAVAVVEPGRVRAYDGDRFLRACEVAGRSPREGRLEVHVPDATNLVEPEATVTLPPLPEADRRDPAAVAQAYGSAYDELLAVAD